MKPAELFGVVVRSVGLVLVLWALWLLFWALLNIIGGGSENVLEMLLNAFLAVFMGVWFLGGAPIIVNWTYPKEPME